MLPEAKTWIKPSEFAELYSVSTKHVYSLLARRTLPASKTRGLGWRINRPAFEKILRRNSTGPDMGGSVQ